MSAQPLTFAEFYPRYPREHSRRGTRVLHFVGTTLFIICLMMLLRTSNRNWLAGGRGSGVWLCLGRPFLR